MNAISTALKDAGVKLPPLNKRIWLWLHDHKGGKTSKAIAAAISARHSDVATQLNAMYKRGMVAKSVPPNPRAGRSVWEWETLGYQFELLPIKKFKRPVPVFDKVPDVPVPGFPKVLANAVDVEALTLREARDMYMKLKEYFA